MPRRAPADRPSSRRRWDRKQLIITLIAIGIVVTFVLSALSPVIFGTGK
jgi:hypothetical protein